LDIGDLETADDTGINWQYWAGFAARTTLHCHILQSLINHEIEPVDRDATVKTRLASASVDAFRREMGQTCQNLPKIRTEMLQRLATMPKPMATDARAAVELLDAACKNPSQETLRRMIEQQVDQSVRTCTVRNIHSEDTLRWNDVMKAWESRTPATGPCGVIVETRLSRDLSTAQFWKLEERHMYTQRNGTLFTGQSCLVFPAELILHFTWRATENPVECTYLKNTM
jgi:hypothetical protein